MAADIMATSTTELTHSFRSSFIENAPRFARRRCLLCLVNEGFKILEEDMCHHPDCIDIIYLYGYGWPAWRGGPMFWAENEVGLGEVLKKLVEYSAKYPGSDYFKPSKLLEECVERNIGISQYYDEKIKKDRSKL